MIDNIIDILINGNRAKIKSQQWFPQNPNFLGCSSNATIWMQNNDVSRTPIPSIVIPKNFNIRQQIGAPSTKTQSIIAAPNLSTMHKHLIVPKNYGINKNLWYLQQNKGESPKT